MWSRIFAASSSSDRDSEYLEDPFADPFADDDEGASFGAYPPELTPDRIEERPRPVPINIPAMGRLNPNVADAVIGAPKKKKLTKEQAYLKSQQRSWTSRSCYNVGLAYMSGIVAGGTVGCVQGFFKLSGVKFKLRLNSMLNTGGTRGIALGNALGIITIMYACAEGALDHYDVDRTLIRYGAPRSDMLTPAIAAGLAGMIYRLPAVGTPNGGILLVAAGFTGVGAVLGINMVANQWRRW